MHVNVAIEEEFSNAYMRWKCEELVSQTPLSHRIWDPHARLISVSKHETTTDLSSFLEGKVLVLIQWPMFTNVHSFSSPAAAILVLKQPSKSMIHRKCAALCVCWCAIWASMKRMYELDMVARLPLYGRASACNWADQVRSWCANTGSLSAPEIIASTP